MRDFLRTLAAAALVITLAGCPHDKTHDPAASPSPVRVEPSPTPTPSPSPSPSPSPVPSPSAAPSPRGPAPDGGEALGAEAQKGWDRGRTSLLVDLVIRAKSFERGFESAIIFLPEMRAPAATAFLARVQDPDARVRERCLQALGEMARLRILPDDLRARSVDSITQRVRGETSHNAWAAAVRALGAIAGVDAGKDVTEALARAVEDDAAVVVRACAEVLGDLNYRPAAPALVAAADRVRDRYAFRALLPALGRVGGNDATERLKRALTSADADDRQAAATALGEASGANAAAALRAAILRRDEEVLVRRAAIAALERMGGEDAKQALESCLSELQTRREDAWVVLAQDVSATLERLKRK